MRYHNAEYDVYAIIKSIEHARQEVTFNIEGDAFKTEYTYSWSEFIEFFNRIRTYALSKESMIC